MREFHLETLAVPLQVDEKGGSCDGIRAGEYVRVKCTEREARRDATRRGVARCAR